MITAMPRIAIAMADFDRAVETFRDGFGLPVVDFSAHTAGLGARVAMCVPPGGSNIELMSPADPTKPLSQAMQRFLDQRGEGFYALMLEAPDPNAEAVELAARSLDVLPLMAGAGGRDVHPRTTAGVLIRVYPNDSAATGGGHTTEAPHLSGIERVVIATHDATLAVDRYAVGFGLPTDAAQDDEARGVRSVISRPPKGGVIELVSVLDATKPFAAEIERQLKERGEGIYAIVLRADDPEAALATLAARGLDTGGALGNEVHAFGARILVTG